MKATHLCAFALAAGLVCGAPALAQKRKESGTSAGRRVREILPEAERVFTGEERVIIWNWFRRNRSGLPPGLAKRDRLPPGLERQLRQRGKLPPGLQKKVQPLPFELESRLRVLPTGYRRAVIAGNVVLMNETTGLIYDLIRNVIP